MFKFEYKEIDFSHKLGLSSFPEDDFSKHFHYFYELVFFVKGDVDYTVNSETHKLKEGDLIVIHPGNVHYGNVHSGSNYDRYVLKFPETILPDFLKEKLASVNPFFSKLKHYSFLFERLEEYVNKYSKEEAYVLLTCDVIRLCILLSNEHSNETQYQNKVIQDIISYIDNNIEQDITLESLSSKFNFSRSYISNEFKKHMKISIMKYIKTKKIFYAHQLIMEGQKKSVVAKKLGFVDYSTFYRSYLKIMGHSPNSK